MPDMSDPAFDTLGAARRLKTAGIEAEQADAIVGVMNQSANRLVTVERFDAGLAILGARIDKIEARIDKVETRIDSVRTELGARIDSVHTELGARIESVHTELLARIESVHTELLARIDALRSELRADFSRSQLTIAGLVIAANALMITVLGIILTYGTNM